MALTNIRIIAPNQADGISMSNDPALSAATPVGNLQSPLRGKVIRTTSRATQYIRGNWVTAPDIEAIALIRHNLNSYCRWRMQLYSAINQSGLIYDTNDLTPTSMLGWTTGFDVNWIGSIKQPKSFQLTISTTDANHPAVGYFEVGRLFMGPVWSPTLNMSYDGFDLSWQDTTRQTRTASGSLRSERGAAYRTLSVNFSVLSEAERTELFELARVVGKRLELVVSALWDDTTPYATRDSLFTAKIAEMPSFSFPFFNTWEATMTLEEN